MQEKAGTFETPSKIWMPIATRFAAYTIVMFFVKASLIILLQDGDITIFKENGPVEWLQFGLLFGASSLFLSGSSVIPAFRENLLLLASLSGFATVRELDTLLDALIPWIGWKIGFAIILYAVWLAFANRNKLRWQISHFLSSPAFAVLWAGFILAVPVAQLLGHGSFLESFMADDYNRFYKRVIEESVELAGYLLIAAGSIESILSMKAAQFCKPPPSEKIIATRIR